MNPERAVCPKCQSAISIGKLAAEEQIVPVAGTTILAVGRHFKTECPKCGSVMHFSAGHHGTILEKEMAQMFPKQAQKRMRLAMLHQDAKIFRECLRGRRMPTDEQLARWKKILVEACG